MTIPILRIVRSVALVLAIALSATVVRAADGDDDDGGFNPGGDSVPTERQGGAARGDGDATSVAILAPAVMIGVTAREQPVIYWSLSRDTDKPISITLNDARKRTVAEQALKGPTKAGVHKVDLAKLARKDGKPVALEPGQRYEFVVEVMADANDGSENPAAMCRVMRLKPADAPAGAAKESDPARRAAAYGKAGVWFDYLDALNIAIEAKPDDQALVRKRTSALAKQRLQWRPDGTVVEVRTHDGGGKDPK